MLEVLVDMFPSAPVYTSIYQREVMPAAYRGWDVRTTWMDRLPNIHRNHQPYLLFYPLAFGGLHLSDYDLVISNKSAFCFGCRTSPGTRHLCYCLTPTRFVWNFDGYVDREQVGGAARRLARPFISWLQQWERAAATRVDEFVSISREVQSRVERIYHRESTIVYPPVDTRRFVLQSRDGVGDYYLVVSRLIPYKRIDLAVEAFNRLGLPLWIGGDGRDRTSLEAMAGPNVRFLGRVSEDELPGLMGRCKGFVFPGLEDFGITPVEAMAAGRPVIAYGRGGALDYVVEGRTGTLFGEQTPEALVDAVHRLEMMTLDPAAIRRHAVRFDTDRFKAGMGALVEAHLAE